MKKLRICITCLYLLVGCANSEVNHKNETIPNPSTNENSSVEFENLEWDINDLVTTKEFAFETPESQAKMLNEKIDTDEQCKIIVPLLLCEGKNAEKFNEQMEKLFLEAKERTKYNSADHIEANYLIEAECVWSKVYLNEAILSMIVYQRPMMWGAGLASVTVHVYNYDIENDEFMTNSEMLTYFKLDKSTLENTLSDYLTTNFIKSEAVQTYQETHIASYDPKVKDCIFHTISDDDLLYMKENEMFIILSGNVGIENKKFEIKIAE